MKSFKAIIVDDELQCRNMIRNLLLKYFPEIEIAAEISNIEDGLKKINELKPDILFLDIQIGEETGFDLLNQLSEINFALIFITAFDNYALKAFRFNAIDYLLKPIIAEELKEAVNKVMNRIDNNTSKHQIHQLYQDIKNPKKIQDKIALPTSDGFIIIPVEEIVYCRASSNYTEFYFNNRKSILSGYTLKQYDEMLTSQSFFRAHRSYLINMSHVKMYKRGDGGEIVMSNGDEIELSRTHKDEFMQRLNVKQ